MPNYVTFFPGNYVQGLLHVPLRPDLFFRPDPFAPDGPSLPSDTTWLAWKPGTSSAIITNANQQTATDNQIT